MNKALTKADIVEAVYNDKALSFNRAEVKNIVENLLVLMKQAIKKDDTLLISGSPQGRGVPPLPQVPCGTQWWRGRISSRLHNSAFQACFGRPFLYPLFCNMVGNTGYKGRAYRPASVLTARFAL